MHLKTMHMTLVTALAAGAGVLAGSAGAAMMHPALGARLAGMGETGVVNLTVNTTSGRLCWHFNLPSTGLTGASVRNGAGMTLARLGSTFTAMGCAPAAKTALEEIATMPGSYRVWVDSPGHPGDLRGTLFAGKATMSHASHM